MTDILNVLVDFGFAEANDHGERVISHRWRGLSLKAMQHPFGGVAVMGTHCGVGRLCSIDFVLPSDLSTPAHVVVCMALMLDQQAGPDWFGDTQPAWHAQAMALAPSLMPDLCRLVRPDLMGGARTGERGTRP